MKSILIAALFIIFSCSYPVREKKEAGEPLTVRYINLNLVFDYVTRTDVEAMKLKKEKEELLNFINESEEKKESDANPTENDKLIREKKKKLSALQKDEEYYKTRILNRINAAVKSVAKEMGADFILAMEEGIVYADRKYDITEDVIREIVKIDRRNSPESR